jgi:hypothetical protein
MMVNFTGLRNVAEVFQLALSENCFQNLLIKIQLAAIGI